MTVIDQQQPVGIDEQEMAQAAQQALAIVARHAPWPPRWACMTVLGIHGFVLGPVIAAMCIAVWHLRSAAHSERRS